MAEIYPKVFFENRLIDKSEAQLSVASSAVLYGLSIYTVFLVHSSANNKYRAFRLADHFQRLRNSAKIVGLDFEEWNYKKFRAAVKQLIESNRPSGNIFIRASLHLTAELAGPRTKNLPTSLSLFAYEAVPILPEAGARLKTSVWRRIQDQSIPARAKINGAYVNSALAKQEALDHGYDDCILLDSAGHICELSAANIFIVRDGQLITPALSEDNLEGINRQTILALAAEAGLPALERSIDLTELYVADEAFACGTSAFLTPIIEIDKRPVGTKSAGRLTERLKDQYQKCLAGQLHPEWSGVL